MKKFVTLDQTELQEEPLNEQQLQEHIESDPNMLDLGASGLKVLQSQKQTPRGRLDLLLEADHNERYVVEIQLGEPDPSHIIRLIEYWEVESRNDMDYTYYAVLVAENIIQGRHFNVLNVLKRHGLPLVAVNVTAVKQADGVIGLSFSRVLDSFEETEDGDSLQEPASEESWTDHHGEDIAELAKKMCQKFGVHPNFTRNYVGMEDPEKGRNARCKIYGRKRNRAIELRFVLSKSAELDKAIEEQGFEPDYRRGAYWIQIGGDADLEKHASFLTQMYRKAVSGKASGDTTEEGDVAE